MNAEADAVYVSKLSVCAASLCISCTANTCYGLLSHQNYIYLNKYQLGSWVNKFYLYKINMFRV